MTSHDATGCRYPFAGDLEYSPRHDEVRDDSSSGGCIMITPRQYEAGEVIVRENDFGETAESIGEGRVEVSKQLDGRNIHLAYLGAGETFGEMSMIDEK